MIKISKVMEDIFRFVAIESEVAQPLVSSIKDVATNAWSIQKVVVLIVEPTVVRYYSSTEIMRGRLTLLKWRT